MKTKMTVECRTDSDDVEFLYYPDNGEGRIPETIVELIEATEDAIRYLQEKVAEDLRSIWKRLDEMEKP